MLLVEKFGRDGNAGEFGAMKIAVHDHEERVGHLETWRTSVVAKFTVIAAVVTTVAGVVTALVLHFVDRALK